jgi:uncharacterized protein (DUF488 family)
MVSTICTIGFAGKTAEDFFRLLTEAGVKIVIDVRENRGGQLSGYAKYPDIAFFLDRVAGIAYRHEPRLAPSPEIRKRYRAGKDWCVYETSFLELMRERRIPETFPVEDFKETVALLCSEALPDKCHRRLLAELLRERLRGEGHTIEILHLVTEKPEKPRKAGRKRKAPASRV